MEPFKRCRLVQAGPRGRLGPPLGFTVPTRPVKPTSVPLGWQRQPKEQKVPHFDPQHLPSEPLGWLHGRNELFSVSTRARLVP